MAKEVSLEDVLTDSNLSEAFKAVKRNKGSAGIDGRDIKATQQHLKQHWHEIEAKLRSVSYSPSPVKGIYIPKASGGKRLLGIPTVQDRSEERRVGKECRSRWSPYH